jgi:molybdopterin-guanine dinucleotide biosynthesis protein A
LIATGPDRPDWIDLSDNLVFVEDVMVAGDPIGPAGGLLAALEFTSARYGAHARVLTLPVDAPFFPSDMSARLDEALSDGHKIAIAQSPGGLQPTFGMWTSGTATQLRARIETGDRALHKLSAQLGAAHVWFDDETAFFNINTPGDLEIARENARRWLDQET